MKAKGTKVPSQSTVDRQGRNELEKQAQPLAKAYEEAKAGKAKGEDGQPIPAPLAGYGSDEGGRAGLPKGEQPPGTPPPAVDAGRWDGSSFISSGLFSDGTYNLTFTKAGHYRYACLVHPRMVGEVVVS